MYKMIKTQKVKILYNNENMKYEYIVITYQFTIICNHKAYKIRIVKFVVTNYTIVHAVVGLLQLL